MLSFVDDETINKVVSLFGEEAKRIIEVLKELDEATDEEIANQTKIQLNDVRKLLYQLYNHSIIGLRRSRESQTGWYVFHWRLQPDQIEGFILNKKRHVLEKLEARLNYEKNHDFFYCYTNNCRRISFEDAVESIFRCPICNEPLSHFDNRKIIETLTNKIDQIRKELGE